MSTTEYQTIPLARLVESAANPRRITSKAADAELADSVKKMGVLEPLLVRRFDQISPAAQALSGVGPERLELIAGHRRLAAARAAGLTEVPVRVLELDDEQALEAAIVENLQRQDVHPLDEAEGFARLIEHHKHAVPDVAARVGKSESYVYQRLALRRLSKKARTLFVAEKITAAHALQLVKVTPEQQDKIIADARLGAHGDREPMSARYLGEDIQRTFFQTLSVAPWKLDDAALLPAVGPCSTCSKRSGAQPGLFLDEATKGEVCTDAKCFEAKSEAHLARARKAASSGGKKVLEISSEYWNQKKSVVNKDAYVVVAEKAPCASVGFMVDGPKAGQSLTVCADPKCKEHGKKLGHGTGTTGGGDATWKKKQAAEAKKRKTEKATRAATAEAVLAKLAGKPLPGAVRHALVAALFHQFTT
ncbi:MAG: ParB/RepB/Spo0J family partition protein, partial [Elusimicrobia bacterium]|nr:ParB/RepB/Spo0J family partition protein [Elusimicrobiota bacterium]